MFASILIVFMEEQFFEGPQSAILEVFPKSIYLTATKWFQIGSLSHSFQVLHFVGITWCLSSSFWHISVEIITLCLSFYFYISLYTIRHYIGAWKNMCIESYLWISLQHHKGVLQNTCYKIRKGLFWRLKLTALDSPPMPLLHLP